MSRIATDWPLKLAAFVGGASIIALLLIVTTDVSLRTFVNSPLTWSVEISTYLMAAITLFGLAWAERRDAHIRVQAILNRLPPGLRNGTENVGRLLSLTVVLVVAWAGAEFCFNAWSSGQRSFGLLETPLWIPRLALAPAFIVLALELMRRCSGVQLEGEGRNTKRVVADWMVLVLVAAACLLWRHDTVQVYEDLALPLPVIAILILVTVLAGTHSPKQAAGYIATIACLFLLGLSQQNFPPLGQGAVLIGLMCLLMLGGVQIGYTLGLCSLWGVLFLLPSGQLAALPERVWGTATSFELTAVPMAVLKAVLLVRSGVTTRLFALVAAKMRRLPGSLAYASVAGSAVFAIVSGSSVATAATVGQVACPEMLKRGYSRRLAFGAVAAGGTLGVLFPPAVAMIIYGAVTGTSITALYSAGFIPGITLTLLFAIVVAVWMWVSPKSGGEAAGDETVSRDDWVDVGLVMALIALVLGSIYLGYATPTEAASVGAFGGGLICWKMGTLSVRMLREAALETLEVTALLMLIIAFCFAMTYVLDFTRMPKLLVGLLKPVTSEPLWLFLGICVMYVLLGAIMDTVSMMLVTIPVVFPLITAAGFDPVWFGVVLVVLMELGLVHPPIGVNLFVVKAVVPGSTLSEAAIGVIPFISAIVLLLAALYIFPAIAMWLPSTMH